MVFLQIVTGVIVGSLLLLISKILPREWMPVKAILWLVFFGFLLAFLLPVSSYLDLPERFYVEGNSFSDGCVSVSVVSVTISDTSCGALAVELAIENVHPSLTVDKWHVNMDTGSFLKDEHGKIYRDCQTLAQYSKKQNAELEKYSILDRSIFISKERVKTVLVFNDVNCQSNRFELTIDFAYRPRPDQKQRKEKNYRLIYTLAKDDFAVAADITARIPQKKRNASLPLYASKRQFVEKKTVLPKLLYIGEGNYHCCGLESTLKMFLHAQTSMEFVLLPGGTFKMGTDDDNETEKPAHLIDMSPFLISRTEVTQGVWKRVMGTKPWRGQKQVKEGDNYPVVCVSWKDAQEFCSLTGLKLPTEAQWEYACRAKSVTRYYWGDEIDGKYAWYWDNAGASQEMYPHKTGQKKANAFGLYDMSGNVWEWCRDWYDPEYYKRSPKRNPPGPQYGSYRVARGGCFYSMAADCSSTRRSKNGPKYSYYDLGFRVVCPDPYSR